MATSARVLFRRASVLALVGGLWSCRPAEPAPLTPVGPPSAPPLVASPEAPPKPPAAPAVVAMDAHVDLLCIARGGTGAVWCANPEDFRWVDSHVSGAVRLGVGSGGQGSCALAADGSVSCWGGRARRPWTVAGLTATSVAVGDDHACALRTDGRVACWGNNELGQLGDGSTLPRSGPVVVRGIERAEQVVAHGRISCARRPDGGVRCWGDGAPCLGDCAPVGARPNVARPGCFDHGPPSGPALRGVLNGAKPTAAREQFCPEAQDVALPGKSVDLVAGFHDARATLDDGRQCRINGLGLTAGEIDCRSAPRPDARSLRVGPYEVCALDTHGGVACREDPFHVGTGDGAAGWSEIADLPEARAIAVGVFFGCALTAAGEVHCWKGPVAGSNRSTATALPLPP